MAKFIEVTFSDGVKELLSTDLIETVSGTPKGSRIRLTKENSKGVAYIEVAEAYEDLKTALLR